MSLKEYGVNESIMPQEEGWRYEQPFQDGIQRIPPKGCAGTPKKLCELVKWFRVNNGIDQGNIEQDVAEYIKRVSPMNDRFPNRKKKEEPRPAKKRPYIERIRDWLISIAPKRPVLLIEDDARERADTCIGCRQNVKWVTGCLPCCENVKSRGQNLRQRPSFELDDSLGACRLHDLYLPAAVFLDIDSLPVRRSDAPPQCWLKDPSNG